MYGRETYAFIISIFAIAIIGLIFPCNSNAVPSAPVLHTVSQSDGSTFKARLWGDEFSHGWETEDGYSMVFDENIRNWTYAITGLDGGIISSSKIIGKDFPPSGIAKHLRPTGKVRETIRLVRASAMSAQNRQKVVPSTGTGTIPVILINFNNTSTTYTASDFNTLLFGRDNSSMKDYYGEVSYGVFSVSAGPGGVVGWYTASNTHDYYGTNDPWGYDSKPGTLVREAVAAADAAGFNFAPYDQDGDCYVDVVTIVHQGTGEEAGGPSTDIWSHRWDLNSAYSYGYSNSGEYTTNDTCPSGGYIKVNDYVIQPETLTSYLGGGQQTMGVFAHEYGHALGLPDLYDTDGSSEGIGDWSIMAGGSWNYVSRPGDRPAHMDAWSKYYLGWVTPTEVSGTLTNESITQAATTAVAYKLLSGTSTSGEYFLVENRQLAGFDEGLPGAGLLIWHIDGNTISSKMSSNTVNDSECYLPSNCSSSHYGVALVQADNLWELEKGTDRGDSGDPYSTSSGNISFTSSSSPNSNLYSGTTSGVSVTDISASGSTMTATLTVSSLPTIAVTNPNGWNVWYVGTARTIRWTYTGDTGAYVKIELYKGGVFNRTITSFTSIGSSGNGYYNWWVPMTQTPGSDYKIKVTSISNSSYTDASDYNFTIRRVPR